MSEGHLCVDFELLSGTLTDDASLGSRNTYSEIPLLCSVPSWHFFAGSSWTGCRGDISNRFFIEQCGSWQEWLQTVFFYHVNIVQIKFCQMIQGSTEHE